jgi:5-aminolevulinate synthase
MVETATRMGTGAGGTRNIAGTNHPLVELERELADLHGKEARARLHLGLRFQRDRHLDARQAHAELPDPIGRAQPQFDDRGRAPVRREKQIFRHNDSAHLEELLRARRERPKLIVFESLYSMDGDVAPIAGICDLAERYGA